MAKRFLMAILIGGLAANRAFPHKGVDHPNPREFGEIFELITGPFPNTTISR